MTNLRRDQLELRRMFGINLMRRLDQNDQSTILLRFVSQATNSSILRDHPYKMACRCQIRKISSLYTEPPFTLSSHKIQSGTQ